ncbi:hypothetical protein I79_011443 [Cricetulus griseus]|uniref:Uncharacterized protein n=1 Tax=Cricetulus griseus TaxID=10029 RepID=G3HL58_CRIGR|nr:hypothetical protein I79_011443 [Cricetulus griseus]
MFLPVVINSSTSLGCYGNSRRDIGKSLVQARYMVKVLDMGYFPFLISKRT